MRIEPSHGDARVVETGFTQATVGELEFGQDAFDGNRRGHLGNGNVRGNAAIPQAFQDVEFTRRPLKADDFGDEANFVVVGRIDIAHGLLVERGEAHRVGLAAVRHKQRLAEVLQRKRTTHRRCLTKLHVRGIEVPQIDENRLGPRTNRRAGLNHLQLGANSRHACAGFQNPDVAKHHKVRRSANLIERQQLGRQFRTDAGRITHRQGNNRKVCAICASC